MRWRGNIAGVRVQDQVADGAIGEELEFERAGTGLFEADGIEVLGQSQHAEAAAMGFFRVLLALELGGEHGGGSGADGGGALAELVDAARDKGGVGRGAMVGLGADAARFVGAGMGGDELGLVEDFDRGRGEPDIDRAADEAVGHRIQGLLDLHVVVAMDLGLAPFGEGIGTGR